MIYIYDYIRIYIFIPFKIILKKKSDNMLKNERTNVYSEGINIICA